MDHDTLADQLIAAADRAARIDSLRPQLGLETIAALKQRVDLVKLRNARRALEIAQVARMAADAIADPAATGLARWAEGNALYHLSRYHEALESYRLAEGFYREPGQTLEITRLRINQVAVLQDLGAFAEALETADLARAACARIGPPARRFLALLEMNSGAAFQQLARPAEALAAYERGRAILVELDDPVETARIDLNRANVLQEMGRFDEAAALYAASRAALAEAGQDQELARAEHNMGKLAYRRGRYQEALRLLEAAHAGFAAIPNPTEVAKANLYRALVYRDLNLLEETVAIAAEATATFRRERTHWELAMAQIVAGVGHARMGLYAPAEALLAAARRLLRRQGAAQRIPPLDLDRAELALAAGNLPLARRLAQRVLRQIDAATWPALALRAHLALAEHAQASRPPDLRAARQHAAAALDLAERHDLPERADAHHQIARIHAADGRPAEAWESCRAALAAAEDLRARLPLDDLQLAFLDRRGALYADAVRLSFQQEEPAATLATLDLALSAPLPRLRPAGDRTLDAELAALREQWAYLQGRLDDLHERQAGAPADLADLDRRRRAVEAAIADLTRRREIRGEGEPYGRSALRPNGGQGELATQIPLSALPSVLPPALAPSPAGPGRWGVRPNTALLALATLGDAIGALLVTDAGIRRYPKLTSAAGLRRWLRSWRFYVEHSYVSGAGTIAAAQGQLARLHAALIAPLADDLAGLRELIVVAPPEWHDLPLAAAFDGRRYLAERLTLRSLSAPGALPYHRDAPAPDGPALVIGCSDGGRLPATLAEAEAVRQALASTLPVNCLIEGGATLAAVRAALPEARLIHIASHAAYRPDNPLFSWVRLADAQLAVADLLALRLARRPLVVLSACETGRGRPRGGGLLGMGRALLLAGASGLILSLWQIPDDSTAGLMRDFYGGLALDAAHDPAHALAVAQRAAIAQGAHPAQWGAFLCMDG